jgi:hypothetical protein
MVWAIFSQTHLVSLNRTYVDSPQFGFRVSEEAFILEGAVARVLAHGRLVQRVAPQFCLLRGLVLPEFVYIEGKQFVSRIEILDLAQVCWYRSCKHFGRKKPCKKSADLHHRQGNLLHWNILQGSTKPLFTTQNRVEISWKKLPTVFNMHVLDFYDFSPFWYFVRRRIWQPCGQGCECVTWQHACKRSRVTRWVLRRKKIAQNLAQPAIFKISHINFYSEKVLVL